MIAFGSWSKRTKTVVGTAATVALAAAAVGVIAAASPSSTSTPAAAAASTGSAYPCTLDSTTLSCPRPDVTVTATSTMTVTSTPTSAAPSSTSSTTSASPSPSPTTTVPAGAFPDAASTAAACTSWTKQSGNVAVAAGQSANCWDITGTVSLGKNATLTNSRVRGVGATDFLVLTQDQDTISNTEIGGGASGTSMSNAIGIDVPPGASVTLAAINVHHTSDAIRWDGGLTMTASYIHDLNSSGGNHADGLQATNAGNTLPTTLSGNYIKAGNNDDVFAQQYKGDLTVSGNLFAAYDVTTSTGRTQTSYGVAVYQAASATIIGNTFTKGAGQQFQVGPIYLAPAVKATVAGNLYTDGAPVK